MNLYTVHYFSILGKLLNYEDWGITVRIEEGKEVEGIIIVKLQCNKSVNNFLQILKGQKQCLRTKFRNVQMIQTNLFFKQIVNLFD